MLGLVCSAASVSRFQACLFQINGLNLQNNTLIVIINREGGFLVPRGSTELQPHDKLLILAKKDMMPTIREIIKG